MFEYSNTEADRVFRNPDVEGLFQGQDGEWYFDQRYTMDFVSRSAILTPRNADLGIIGPDVWRVPDELATGLGLEK